MRRDLPALLARHWTQLALLLLGVLAPLLLVADLVGDVFRGGGFPWDQGLLTWYAAHRTPELTAGAKALALIGGVRVLPILTGLIALALYRFGTRAHAWFVIAAVAGATGLNVLAKVAFQRPRPDQLVAVLAEPGYSFPSGHAMANMALGVALALIFARGRTWPLAALGLVWGLLVGVSRNYLGVHYPTDVLAGFATSTAWVTGLYLILSRRWRRLKKTPRVTAGPGELDHDGHPAEPAEAVGA